MLTFIGLILLAIAIASFIMGKTFKQNAIDNVAIREKNAQNTDNYYNRNEKAVFNIPIVFMVIDK